MYAFDGSTDATESGTVRIFRRTFILGKKKMTNDKQKIKKKIVTN